MAGNSERQSKLTIDLGGEQIALVRLESVESLSQPFHVSVDMLATLGEVNLLPHLGKPAAISISEDETFLRYFHGILVDGEFLGDMEGDGYLYRLVLRPKAYLFEQNRNFKIFQDKAVNDILKEVLAERKIDVDFKNQKAGKRVRAYCVQYGESDFGFLSRLMEEEGIYYHYLHESGKHTLVLCDGPSCHVSGKSAILAYNPTSAYVVNVDSASRTSTGGGSQFVQSWTERVTSGAETVVTLRDFDFMHPDKPLEVSANEQSLHDDDANEVYDYPGRYYVAEDGENLSAVRLNARRANRRTYSGESQLGSISNGTKFKLKNHGIERFNAEYLITHTHHSISAEAYRAGGGGNNSHFVRFDVVPADTLWQAPQISRRPVVNGPETALVTGPKGEEIYVDEYARIKVQFHWDREGQQDDHSSCWIRVSQTGGLGNLIIPRVGHEVLVDFINGDPDRPIVVGRVFNKSHMPVYKLPDEKTKTVFRTKTYTKVGGKAYPNAEELDTGKPGVNELRFEDKDDAQEVFVHAERDMNTRVRRVETHHVGLDQEVKIGQDRKKKIKRDEKIEIGANRDTKIEKDETLEITGKRKTKIKKTDLLDVSDSIKIKAGTKIELIVGGSSITIDQKGVKIDGMQLQFKGGAKADLESPMTTVKGTAMLTAQGGLVKIN